MTLKMMEGKNFIEAYESLKYKQLPIQVSYKLAKIYKNVKEDIDFYSEKLQEIILEYAEFDENGELVYLENGKFIKVKEDLQNECSEKIAELDNLEININIEPLSINDLSDLSIDPMTIEKLLPIME